MYCMIRLFGDDKMPRTVLRDDQWCRIEVFVPEKQQGFRWMLSASYVNSKFYDLQGVLRSTDYDYKYIANLMLGHEWKLGKEKRNALQVYSRTILRGGNPVTPLDLLASAATGETIFQEDRLNESRLRPYFRPDLGIHFQRYARKWAYIISLDMQNFISFRNPREQFYNPENQSIGERYFQGIIPILNFKAEF